MILNSDNETMKEWFKQHLENVPPKPKIHKEASKKSEDAKLLLLHILSHEVISFVAEIFYQIRKSPNHSELTQYATLVIEFNQYLSL